jgi:hypothetical protein
MPSGSGLPALERRRNSFWNYSPSIRSQSRHTHECPFGLVEIRFMGEVTAGRVVFGPDDVEPLLGVTALESVGITVDPASRTLKRLPAIPLKRMSGRRGLAGA